MSIKKPKQAARNDISFDAYYQGRFGHRWEALRHALGDESQSVAWAHGLRAPYYLDAASVAVAHLLPLAGATDIVDLCAAPGGKSLILATRAGEKARLTANDRSRDRRARLLRVLDAHLPEEVRTRVAVTGHDAARWALHQPESCDAVLADVPCSSERHVLGSERALDEWGVARIRQLARRQYAILAAAIDALRPGGYALYATCALTTEENDAVIARTLSRRAARVELISITETPEAAALLAGTPPVADTSTVERAADALRAAEPTAYGIHILPDVARGAGPMYAALLRRR